jgi:hypothetical protein
MERIWPALQGIDGSSGALGSAVCRTLETLIPFVALCAIKHLLAGGGYEPSMLDMLKAHRLLRDAAARCGRSEWAEAEVDQVIERGTTSDRQEFLQVLISERRRQA